jgi:hypothetical protein
MMAISERRREIKRRRQRREKRLRCRIKPEIGGRRSTDPPLQVQTAAKDEKEPETSGDK